MKRKNLKSLPSYTVYEQSECKLSFGIDIQKKIEQPLRM